MKNRPNPEIVWQTGPYGDIAEIRQTYTGRQTVAAEVMMTAADLDSVKAHTAQRLLRQFWWDTYRGDDIMELYSLWKEMEHFLMGRIQELKLNQDGTIAWAKPIGDFSTKMEALADECKQLTNT